MGTGEEQQQQQEGGFQREVDAAEEFGCGDGGCQKTLQVVFCNSSVRNLQGERL